MTTVEEFKNKTNAKSHRILLISVSELLGKTMTWLATACVFNDPFALADEIKLSGIIEVQSL